MSWKSWIFLLWLFEEERIERLEEKIEEQQKEIDELQDELDDLEDDENGDDSDCDFWS